MRADMTNGVVAAGANAGISTAGIHAGHASRTFRVNAAFGTTGRRTSYIIVDAGAHGTLA